MFLPREDSAMSERTAKSKSRGLPPPPCGPRSTSPGKVRTFFVAFRYVYAISDTRPQSAHGSGSGLAGGRARRGRGRGRGSASGRGTGNRGRGQGEGEGGACGGGAAGSRRRRGSSKEGKKRLGQYSSTQSILLVGDGNFSFSLALAAAFGSGANLVATSLDTYGLPPFHRFRFLSCPVKLPPAR